jgi:hypothetical protein
MFPITRHDKQLYVVGRRLKALNLKVEAEGASLRDKLLPLQRNLSDRLDQALNDPALNKLFPPKPEMPASRTPRR